jgi:hypothetical protein
MYLTIEDYLKRPKPTKAFCMICKGIFCYNIRCIICKRTAAQTKKDYPELVEHYLYLHKTWLKMKKYKQQSCGIPEMDRDLKEAFGDWLQ